MTKIKITVPGIYRIDGRNTGCTVGEVYEATHRESHALVHGGYAEYVQKILPQRLDKASENDTTKRQRKTSKK